MQTLKKIFNLLSKPEKKKIIILLLIFIIGALLDAIGVVSIMPFIAVLANPKLIETNFFLSYLYNQSANYGISNINEFFVFLGIIVFLLLIISLIFRAFNSYHQVQFALMREYSIGKRLVEGYLHQPYSWFLNRNVSEIGKGILSEVGQAVTLTILPILNLISQLIVTIIILLLLFVVDPMLTVSVILVLGSSYVIIFLFMKTILLRLGSQGVDANRLRFKSILDAFGAAKEIKVNSLEKFYISRFEKPARVYAKNQSLAQIISQLPRYFLEGIAFGSMIIVVIFLIQRDGGFANTISIVSLYALAGYRLMPALQQIYTGFTQINFSKAALDLINNEIINLKNYKISKDAIASIPFSKNINLTNVYFSYPNTSKLVLKNINLNINVFSKVGIIGPTGSGKTTLVDVIIGLHEPTQGNLNVDGKIIFNENIRSWQKNIGYVPQNIFLTDDTIKSNIALGIDDKKIDQDQLEKAAKIAKIHEFIVNELPNSYNTNIGDRGAKLSGGQRQRIGIARAIYHNRKVLIFDESTSSLDNLTENEVMNSINNLGDEITIILIAHRISTLSQCDQIFLIENGELKDQGTFNDIIKKYY